MLLADRVAIVTGATSGIGRATALECARKGARVVIASSESARVLSTLEAVRALSPDSEAFETDVANAECLEELGKFVLARYGRIDILVNNAGITRDALLLRMKDADWFRVLNTNLTSVFRLTRIVLKPMMKARYGRIVNLTSVVGATGNAGQANYAAAKAGMTGFSKSVAQEVASRGITVNCVAPGFIETPMTGKLNSAAREAILAQIPQGAMGTVEDVAHAVVFLASERARYITGETLHVNGGMYMS